MEIYVSIPQSMEDVDSLLWRLEKFHSVRTNLVNDRIILYGPASKLVAAQNYALRFIGPESVSLIHVSIKCLSLFRVNGLIEHFEKTFEIIIAIKAPDGILLKGRKADNERVAAFLKNLDFNCAGGMDCPDLTPFKLSSLRQLCERFLVNFDELPTDAALRTGLLLHLTSLGDLSEKETTVPDTPSFVEVYRNPVFGPLTLRNNNPNKEDNSGHISPVGRTVEDEKNVVGLPNSGNSENLKSNEQQLRSVVIDGSNVAFAHGNQQQFSPGGISLALDFFLKRGHTKVVAILPRFRRGRGGELFDRLERAGYLCYSSSRYINDKHQVADDDRIILQLAVERDAVVVSNDQFRQYRDENEKFRQLINDRLLQYTLALDTFLIAEDPHGANGPSLSECLCVPAAAAASPAETTTG